MAAEKTATFGIKVDAQTNAPDAANSVEALRQRIVSSQDAVKAYSASLRNLRGSSDEVKAAKEKLKTAVQAERDAISQATLALGKEGTTFDQASKKAREHAKAIEEAKKKHGELSGPLGDVKNKLTDLDGKLSTGAGAASLFAAGAVAATAAVVALTGALASGVFALGKWIAESANLLRTQNLMREASTGSAVSALHLGHQIEALGAKVPLTREQLQGMSVDLTRTLEGTRVGGQGIVDTFNAVAQASAAMGDSAGKSIEGLITRSKQFGRLGIGAFELQGTGITRDNVAAQLAARLKISLADARQQLALGRVNVNDGAAAIRAAVEKNFGSINARRMLDLTVISNKFKDSLTALTSGVDIEPLLKGFGEFAKLFGPTTVTGKVLKGLVTDIGNGLVATFTKAGPIATKIFKQIVIEGLKLEIAFLKLRNQFRNTFGPGLKDIDLAAAAIRGLDFATNAVINTVNGLYKAFVVLSNPEKAIVDLAGEMVGLGGAIIDGLINGLKAGALKIGAAITGIAGNIKDGFKNALGIHSPSRVFAGFGLNIGAGLGQGIGQGAPQARAAMQRLTTGLGAGVSLGVRPPGIPSPLVAPPRNPLAPPAAPAQAGPRNANVTVTLNFPNAKDGASLQSTISSDGFRAALIKALEDALKGRGVPTQGEAAL